MHRAAMLRLLRADPIASWLVRASQILATLLDWRRILAIRCDWADKPLRDSVSLALHVAWLRPRSAYLACVGIHLDLNRRHLLRLHLLVRLLLQPCETVDWLAFSQSVHLIPVVPSSGTSHDWQSVCFE